MQHTEAFSLLWLHAGARFESIYVSACAETARNKAREVMGDNEPLVRVIFEGIDSAEAKLNTLGLKLHGDQWRGAVELDEAVAADRREAEVSLEPMRAPDLWSLVFQVAGAATAGMWQRSGEVFPSEEVSDAARRVMADHGFEPPVGYRGTEVEPYEPKEA